MFNRKFLSFMLIFVMVLSVFAPSVSLAAGEQTLTIIHTNDIHGRYDYNEKDGHIGYARIKTYVDGLKKENSNVLLLDAGDTLHGTNLVNTTRGELGVQLMSEVGYDAMVAGNHDYNYGYDRLIELKNIAKFPIIVSNVLNKDGKHDFETSIVKEMNGLKVGIFALSTDETRTKSHPANTAGLTFQDNIEVGKAMVKDLRENKKVDIVIGIGHLGTDKETINTSIKLLEGVEGIDVFVDGHSHTKENKVINGALLVQVGEYGEDIGRVDLKIENGKIVSKEVKVIPFEEAKDITPDAEVEKVINAGIEKNKEIMNEVIGNAIVKLEGAREFVRTAETNLGNFLTDAMLEKGREDGAEIVITNGGGMRASIEAGKITKGDVLSVLPFENSLQMIEATGAEIKAALENGAEAWPEPKGAFPHVAGLSYKIDGAKKAGERIFDIKRITDEKLEGTPIDVEKTYKLLTNDFMAAGGDGYEMFKGKTVLKEYPSLFEVVVEYIQAKKEVYSKAQGRITGVNKPAEKPAEEPKPVEKPVEVFSASVSVQNVTLNGEEVKIAGYNIAGSNYFKLRDLAAILRETNDKFNVSYDQATRTINLVKGEEYALIDGDLKELAKEKQNATKSTQAVLIKGIEGKLEIEAFFINGNNFFKIRDLGQALGFGVDYNAETNTVILTTVKAAEKVKVNVEAKPEYEIYILDGKILSFKEFEKQQMLEQVNI